MKKIVMCCLMLTGAVVAAEQPNIILIFADDMGYGDAGCYGDDNLVPTPNIDRLAEEGVRFTDGYVTCSVCAPSRYGLLTGMYQQKLGVQWNQDAFARIPGWGETETLEHNRIPATQKMINQTLQDAGYHTALIGKSNLPCHPKTTFDETLSVMEFAAEFFPDENGHYVGVNEPRAGGLDTRKVLWGPERKGDEYLTDRLGRQAVDFIERNQDKPFFLYLAFNAVHSPLHAKKSHRPQVEHLKTEALKLYGAMTISMDENIGKVLNALDRLELSENTIVAFVSDNGPTFSFTVGWPEDWPKEILGSAGPLRGHKGTSHEGGLRVPYILRWPGKLEAGQVYKEPVSTLDLYPTFCAAASAEISSTTQLDGVDLYPYLTGKKAGSPHDVLYFHRDEVGALRRGDWKLGVWKGIPSLYNLKEDIAESKNVANKHPELTEELLAEYNAFVSSLPPALNLEGRPKK